MPDPRFIMYDNQMNPGYFTDVQFIKDDSWSYTYDSKGNSSHGDRDGGSKCVPTG